MFTHGRMEEVTETRGRAQGAHPPCDPRRRARAVRGQPLAALSLRQVAKQVGIVPTAFYRHFESIDELGLALVDESFSSLRDLLRAARTFDTPPASDRALFLAVVDNSVNALVVPRARRPTGTSASSPASGWRARRRSARPSATSSS